MSRPRFLADEDLRNSIIAAVCRLEPTIDFLTVVQAGRSGAPDPEVLAFADTEQRIVVSHDLSTMKAAAEERMALGNTMSGLFLVPKSKSRRSVAESLLLVWAASEAEEWRDQIIFLPM